MTEDQLQAGISHARGIVQTATEHTPDLLLLLARVVLRLDDDLTDALLVSDGVKHDPRCAGEQLDAAPCLRCRHERLRRVVSEVVPVLDSSYGSAAVRVSSQVAARLLRELHGQLVASRRELDGLPESDIGRQLDGDELAARKREES